MVKLELVLLAWSLRKMKRMKEKLGEAPKKKMKGRWCSSLASVCSILWRCSGEVEGLQWWERGGSSSMAWLEKEGWRE